jgi:zona occludens toxin (predicted ATPase)
MTQQDRALIARIERMGYEEMVRELRFAPIGAPMFTGEAGEIFGKRLRRLQSSLPVAEQVAISKKVGHTPT